MRFCGNRKTKCLSANMQWILQEGCPRPPGTTFGAFAALDICCRLTYMYLLSDCSLLVRLVTQRICLGEIVFGVLCGENPPCGWIWRWIDRFFAFSAKGRLFSGCEWRKLAFRLQSVVGELTQFGATILTTPVAKLFLNLKAFDRVTCLLQQRWRVVTSAVCRTFKFPMRKLEV